MNFRHKGLRDLFLLGKTSGVIPTQVKRLRHRLAVIDAACCLADIDMPGYRLHPLSGDRDGIWAISVSVSYTHLDVYKRQIMLKYVKLTTQLTTLS